MCKEYTITLTEEELLKLLVATGQMHFEFGQDIFEKLRIVLVNEGDAKFAFAPVLGIKKYRDMRERFLKYHKPIEIKDV